LHIENLRDDIVFEKHIRDMDFVFHTTWGLFSPRDIDAGTWLLIEYMLVNKSDICLDLGCGYGPIGLTMARLASDGKVFMVDSDFVAVEYSKKNARLNQITNCEVFLSNAFSHIPEDMQFDLVASNLPANVGRELLYIILEDTKKRLREGGRIYVVTISGLRDFIRKNFIQVFGNYKKVKQGKAYTVAMAVKGYIDDNRSEP